MNVARLLRARALEAPERPAIIERAGAISFAEFDAASAAAAAMLAARGILPGARVLLLSPMSIDLYVADAKTGEVLRKVTDTATSAHSESLQFISSAGAWDRTSKKFVDDGKGVTSGKPAS